MSYIFYVFGVLCLLAAGMAFTSGASAGSPAATGFSTIYAFSAVVAAMGFFAVGQILERLGVIAKNSRHLRYLELLDPQLAAQREAEIAEAERRRFERSERTLFGFGPKRAAR